MRREIQSRVKSYRSNERAVSPVIGIAIAIALVVVIAAVAYFALGIGQSSGPNAELEISQESTSVNMLCVEFCSTDKDKNGVAPLSGPQVVVEHTGGDAVPTEEITVRMESPSRDGSGHAIGAKSAPEDGHPALNDPGWNHQSPEDSTIESGDETAYIGYIHPEMEIKKFEDFDPDSLFNGSTTCGYIADPTTAVGAEAPFSDLNREGHNAKLAFGREDQSWFPTFSGYENCESFPNFMQSTKGAEHAGYVLPGDTVEVVWTSDQVEEPLVIAEYTVS